MCAKTIRLLASVQWRIRLCILLLPYVLLMSALTKAAETVTMEAESQVLDLDAGTIVDAMTMDPAGPTGADVQLAYNADRTPHAVVFPVGEGVEIAFAAGVGFDGISSADLASLAFSAEPSDLSFSANDCVVVRTDQGTFFKLGNAIENGMSVTFDYEQL